MHYVLSRKWKSSTSTLFIIILAFHGLSNFRKIKYPSHDLNIASSKHLHSNSSEIELPLQSVLTSQVKKPEATKILACTMFRIWQGDQFGMTRKHLKDWISYLYWAGVTHVRLYDHCHHHDECQTNIRNIDYIRWQSTDYASAQIAAIRDCISNALAKNFTWVLSCDIDEYPFSPVDPLNGFLSRLIHSLSSSTSQILLRSMFFGEQNGTPLKSNQSIHARYLYRTRIPEGEHHRTKSIFMPSRVAEFQPNIVHELLMQTGDTVVAAHEKARLNHYWGYRLEIGKDDLVFDSSLAQAWNHT